MMIIIEHVDCNLPVDEIFQQDAQLCKLTISTGSKPNKFIKMDKVSGIETHKQDVIFLISLFGPDFAWKNLNSYNS